MRCQEHLQCTFEADLFFQDVTSHTDSASLLPLRVLSARRLGVPVASFFFADAARAAEGVTRGAAGVEPRAGAGMGPGVRARLAPTGLNADMGAARRRISGVQLEAATGSAERSSSLQTQGDVRRELWLLWWWGRTRCTYSWVINAEASFSACARRSSTRF